MPMRRCGGAFAENPRWLEEDARQDVEGRVRCDLEGILASLRANTGVRASLRGVHRAVARWLETA